MSPALDCLLLDATEKTSLSKPELTLEFSGLIFLVLISGSLVTKRFHHSILLI